MTGFTPGEWTVERYGDGDSLVIHSDQDSRVCFMATPGDIGDPKMIEADAHLIAAAKNLHAALERMVEHASQGKPVVFHDMKGSALRTARAALSKARGEQS